jgi:hypothetical protein
MFCVLAGLQLISGSSPAAEMALCKLFPCLPQPAAGNFFCGG